MQRTQPGQGQAEGLTEESSSEPNRVHGSMSKEAPQSDPHQGRRRWTIAPRPGGGCVLYTGHDLGLPLAVVLRAVPPTPLRVPPGAFFRRWFGGQNGSGRSRSAGWPARSRRVYWHSRVSTHSRSPAVQPASGDALARDQSQDTQPVYSHARLLKRSKGSKRPRFKR